MGTREKIKQINNGISRYVYVYFDVVIISPARTKMGKEEKLYIIYTTPT